MLTGTDLYRHVIAQGDSGLMHKVWEPTPWVVDVWTGGFSNNYTREQEIRRWCAERFGPECFVIGGREGKWQRGGATIHGWTWMGFETEAMMNEFLAAWGDKPTEDAC